MRAQLIRARCAVELALSDCVATVRRAAAAAAAPAGGLRGVASAYSLGLAHGGASQLHLNAAALIGGAPPAARGSEGDLSAAAGATTAAAAGRGDLGVGAFDLDVSAVSGGSGDAPSPPAPPPRVLAAAPLALGSRAAIAAAAGAAATDGAGAGGAATDGAGGAPAAGISTAAAAPPPPTPLLAAGAARRMSDARSDRAAASADEGTGGTKSRSGILGALPLLTRGAAAAAADARGGAGAPRLARAVHKSMVVDIAARGFAPQTYAAAALAALRPPGPAQ